MYDPEVVDRFVEVYPQLLLESDDEETAAGATFDVGMALSQHVNIDAICTEAWTRIEPQMPASTCVLYLCHASGDRLVASAVQGEYGNAIRGLTILTGRQLSGWVAAHRAPIVNSDAALDLASLPCALEPPLRACLSVPMVTQGDLVGVLTVYSMFLDPFTDQHRRILESIAGPLAALIGQSPFAKPDLDKGLGPCDRAVGNRPAAFGTVNRWRVVETVPDPLPQPGGQPSVRVASSVRLLPTPDTRSRQAVRLVPAPNPRPRPPFDPHPPPLIVYGRLVDSLTLPRGDAIAMSSEGRSRAKRTSFRRTRG